MNNKEQIIIDGVGIIDCDYFYVEQETDQVKCDNYSGYCREHKNCPFKQLARKTQECEELEKQLETSEEWRIKAESLNEKLELRNTCYRKALEEIEKYCGQNRYAGWVDIEGILDIINKAKGGEDER